ncbi:MAG: hypothetical protein NUW01_04695 [Gemmatimonadaceae bacterium]|nr:hypothetical protein [Gemmatimonadaceae bacterium]
MTERLGEFSYRVIADFYMPEVSEAEALANARLFAVQRELLAVAQRINDLRGPDGILGDVLGGLGDWLEDTIAKALGEQVAS